MKFVRIIYQTFSGIEYFAIKVIKMSKTNAWIDIASGIYAFDEGSPLRHKCYHKFFNILQLAKQINTKFLWTSESHQFWESEYDFAMASLPKEGQAGDSSMVEWILISRWNGIFAEFQYHFSVVRFRISRSTSPSIPSNIIFIIQGIRIHKMAINRLNFQRKTGTICLMSDDCDYDNAQCHV